MTLIYLKLEEEKCLVVGGGRVALRKVRILLAASARVLVVSPSLHPELEKMADRKVISHLPERFRPEHLAGVRLVVGATDDEATNRAVAEQCRSRHIPVNIVDNPSLCSFFFPSFVKQGPLEIAISTGGKSPAFARLLREKLEEQLERDVGEFLLYLGSLRPLVLREIEDPQRRRRVFLALAGDDFYRLYKKLSPRELEHKVRDMLHEPDPPPPGGGSGKPDGNDVENNA